MAVTSGTVTTNTVSKSSFYVYWSQVSQSIANNQTTINWVAGINTGTSGSHDSYYSNSVKIYNIYINGVLVSNGGTWSNITTAGNHDLLSGISVIQHNADGSKSFSVSISAWTYSNANYSGSGSFELTSIPRQATINSAPNFNDEQNPTITYTNSAGNSVTSLQACISLTGATDDVPYRDIPKTGSSYTFNLTAAERNVLRNNTPGKTRTVIFHVKTVIGGNTYFSTKNVTFSITNANPAIGTIGYEDTNSTITAITGNNQKIVQNKSTIQFSFANIASYKGATLSKITININGVSKNVTLSGSSVSSKTYDFGTVNVSSNTNATIIVYDSRGFTRTYTKAIQIIEYSNPTASISIRRQLNYYSECYLTVDANYSSLDGHNTIQIQYRIKKNIDSTWNSWITISDNVQTTFTADNNYSWDLQVQLVDILGTTVTYNRPGGIPVGTPLVFYDLLKESVGINCFPEKEGSLEINGIDLRNIYSTTEQQIGTWEDGKTMYMTVLSGTTPSTADTWENSGFNIPGNFLGIGYGYINASAGEQYPLNNQNNVFFYHDTNTGILYIKCSNYFRSRDFKVEIRYTKT